MKPFRTLAEVQTADGGRLTLHEHDGDYFLKLNGRQVMASTATSSELQLAELACAGLRSVAHPRILIGGLGLGFTLKRVLALVSSEAKVQVAELLPEVVAWNRELLGDLNGPLLRDPRVEMLVADVYNVIKQAPEHRYDAVLLDVDNGPVAMVQDRNARLYDRIGLGRISRALVAGGRVAFWSADEDRPFAERLARSGLKVEAFEAKSHERAKRCAHRIYVGERVVE